MSSLLFVASTDPDRRLLVLTVEGDASSASELEPLRLVLPAVPAEHALLVDLSEAGPLDRSCIDVLRDVAREAVTLGLTMIVVCADLARRTELILADLDTLVPVVAAIEQAVPLTRAAA